jgi:hypothetical protein
MRIWFDSNSTEATILTFLRNAGETPFNGIVEAVFGPIPRQVEPDKAAEIDERARRFYRAMGQLIEARYIVTRKDTAAKQVLFSIHDPEESRILLEKAGVKLKDICVSTER